MSNQKMREALQAAYEAHKDDFEQPWLSLAAEALATPPAAPVVPEEMQHQPMRADESRSDQLEAYAYVNGWNACRRAMLAAAPAQK